MTILKKYYTRLSDIFQSIVLAISISYIVLFICSVSIQLIPYVNIENYPESIDYGILSEEQIGTFNEIICAVESNKDSINCPPYSTEEQHEILTQLGMYYGTTEKVELLIYWNGNNTKLNLDMFKKLAAQKAIIDARVDEAVSTLIEGPNEYKLLQICNYISRKITYTDGCRDIITALNGKGVCNSYSMIFYKMATRLGIKTYICCGYAGDEYHAWNMVELNSEHVYYDVTWYDSIIHDIRYINSKSSWERDFQINNKWSMDLK